MRSSFAASHQELDLCHGTVVERFGHRRPIASARARAKTRRALAGRHVWEGRGWNEVDTWICFSNMDTLGIEPRASRMLSGGDTTTPCALLMQSGRLLTLLQLPLLIACGAARLLANALRR